MEGERVKREEDVRAKEKEEETQGRNMIREGGGRGESGKKTGEWKRVEGGRDRSKRREGESGRRENEDRKRNWSKS